MSTVSSEIEVAKIACDLLKETPLSSFADNTTLGRWMLRNFGPCRNMVLASKSWPFARKRAILLAMETRPAFGWSYQYQKPEDCIRVLPLREGGDINGTPIKYEEEGGLILTNSPGPLRVRYLFEQIDTSTWTPHFVNALSVFIALRLSQFLTGKSSYTVSLKELYKEAMEQAAFDNAALGTPEETIGQAYVDVRSTGYTGY